MKAALLAAVALLPHPASACRLALSLDASAGRVAGVTVAVPHAATEAAAVPAGWRLSIGNDPSWRTTVDGRAVVGAAFLSVAELDAMLRFRPEPGFTCESLGRLPGTAVTITFYRGDRLVRVQIARGRLSFAPESSGGVRVAPGP